MKTQYNKSFEKKEEEPIIREPIHFEKKEPPEEVISASKKPPLVTVVNCFRLNIREKPTRQSAIVGIVDSGETLLVRSETNQEWIYISGPSGLNGYVMRMFIEKVVVKEEV